MLPAQREGGKPVKIDRDGYRRAVAQACRAAGVPHWHPHQLRHSRATEVQRIYESDAQAAAAIGTSEEVAARVYIDPSEAVRRRMRGKRGERSAANRRTPHDRRHGRRLVVIVRAGRVERVSYRGREHLGKPRVPAAWGSEPGRSRTWSAPLRAGRVTRPGRATIPPEFRGAHAPSPAARTRLGIGARPSTAAQVE